MDAKTVYTKTAKGLTQVNQRTQSLSRELMRVLKAIDGRSNIEALIDKADLALPLLTKALSSLQKDGFVKVFEIKAEEPLSDFGGDSDDFDFTKPAPPKPVFDPLATTSFKPSQYRRPASADQVERATPPASSAATPTPTPPTPSSAPAAAPAMAAPVPAAAPVPTPLAEQPADEAELARALTMVREKAQAAARARTEREAQLRARLDVEAQARRDAEVRAVEEAKRAQAAAEAARQALDAKIAEEKKREDAAAAARAATIVTQEQAEKEALHQQVIAAARANAEAEVKALAEARSRAEAEARALAQQRAQAEEAARKQQQEFEAAQRDLRHQLKEEIEAKVRAEMETLMKSDVEESARAEVEAAIMAEARDEARRMLEEQLTAERSMIARAEAEAKVQAEAEAKKMLAEQEVRIRAEMDAQIARIREESARLEAESKLRAEAQAAAAAKAAAEFEARLKLEAEARRAMELEAEKRRQLEDENRKLLEARAQAEAADRARVEAEMKAKLAAEQQAKIQAQARMLIEQEMREKSDRESQQKLDLERKARAEAEQKAVLETKAREVASLAAAEQMAQRELIEQNAEARIAVERKGREKAEEKARAEELAEQQQREAQVARLRELAQQREYEGDRNDEPVFKKRAKKGGGGLLRWLMVGVVSLAVLAVVLLQVVPLGAVNAKLSKALAEWLHDEVEVSSLKIALLPRPHVKIENLQLGQLRDAKAASGKLYMDLTALFGDRFVVDTLELNDVSIAADALPRALKWADAEARGKRIEIDKIVLRGVKVSVAGLTVEEFDADIKLDRAGKIVRASARASGGKWTLDVVPNKVVAAADAPEGTAVNDPWAVDFSARGWNLPMGAPIPLSSLAAKGTMYAEGMVFPQVEAKLFEGSATGTLKISWQNGIKFDSAFALERIKVDQLTQVFTRDISLGGRMEGKFTADAAAATVGVLLDKPNIQGAFDVKEGLIGNVDLVQLMRTPGTVGGQSKFGELSGQLRVSDGMVYYEKLKLTGGVLLANGNVSVPTAGGTLSGNIYSEIRSTVAQDRGTFGVSGKVARPILRRGG